MIRASLKFKVGFYIVIALTVAVFIFTFMVVRNNREAAAYELPRGPHQAGPPPRSRSDRPAR